MAFDKTPVIVRVEPSFESVLDTACERLRDKHIQYSIRRIREMDGELEMLEAELDELLEYSSFF